MPINPERQRMLDDLAAANAETVADMADRELHGDPEQWTVPPRPTLPPPMSPIRKSYAEPLVAPDLSAEAMQRWNDWFDSRFRSAIWEVFENDLAEMIGEHTGECEKELRTEIAAAFATLRAEVDALRTRVKRMKGGTK